MPADLPQSPYFPRATRMAAKLAAAGHSLTPESLCDLFRRTFDLEDLRGAAALRQPPERIEVEDERVSVVGPRGLLAEIRRSLSVAVDDDRIQEASRVLEGVAVFT